MTPFNGAQSFGQSDSSLDGFTFTRLLKRAQLNHLVDESGKRGERTLSRSEGTAVALARAKVPLSIHRICSIGTEVGFFVLVLAPTHRFGPTDRRVIGPNSGRRRWAWLVLQCSLLVMVGRRSAIENPV